MMKRVRPEDKTIMKGHVKIVLKDENTGKERVIEKDNLIVDSGANLLRDFLKGDSVSGLTHLAIGTGTTSPQAIDTQLENEVYRQAFTDVAVENRTLRLTTFITSSAYSGEISELGLFGNGATDTAGSGTLFSRVVVSTFTKSDSEAMTVEWTLTF